MCQACNPFSFLVLDSTVDAGIGSRSLIASIQQFTKKLFIGDLSV